MENVNSWGNIIISSFRDLWIKVVEFIPQFIGALIVLIGGLIIATVLGNLAKKIMHYTRIDNFAEKAGIKREFERINVHFSFAGLIGWAVKWFFIIATLIAVVDILRIPQVTLFLQEIAFYIPNVIVAIAILSIGFIAGNLLSDVVKRALIASRIASPIAVTSGTIAKWAIIIFAFMAALVQLGIAAGLIHILFTGLVAMFALAGGLAFGLGGRESAARWLNEIEREISQKK